MCRRLLSTPAGRLVAGAGIALACVACGKSAASPAPTRPASTPRSGAKNYTEQFILGQLYVQALQAQGFSATLNQNIGPTEVTMQAMKAGSLSIYPEYLNVFHSAVAGYTRRFRTQLGAYKAAQRYATAHGLELLAPTPFSDTDGIAVTDAYGQENRLRSIGDLRRVDTQLTMGRVSQ